MKAIFIDAAHRRGRPFDAGAAADGPLRAALSRKEYVKVLHLR